MDRQTIPGEYAVRADLVGGTGWVIGNSSQLHIEVILDLIQQSLDAFAKLLHRRRVRLIDVLQFMEHVVEFVHGRPRTSTDVHGCSRSSAGPIIGDLEEALLDLL